MDRGGQGRVLGKSGWGILRKENLGGHEGSGRSAGLKWRWRRRWSRRDVKEKSRGAAASNSVVGDGDGEVFGA